MPLVKKIERVLKQDKYREKNVHKHSRGFKAEIKREREKERRNKREKIEKKNIA